MSRYSVAEAKNTLSSLLDKAIAGEEVVITRHGKAIAKIRPMAAAEDQPQSVTYEWLRQRRDARKPIGITSVQLLKELHDENDL